VLFMLSRGVETIAMWTAAIIILVVLSKIVSALSPSKHGARRGGWGKVLAIVSAYVAFGALILAAAALFDRVSSETLRSSVKDALTTRESIFQGDILTFTKVVLSNTINRLFSSRTSSLRNIVVASLMSIGGIAFFVTLGAYTNGFGPLELLDFSNDSWYVQIGAGLVVLSFVVFVDCLSFLKTALFMRIASQLNSRTEILFIAACDILLAINIFVFVFPIGPTIWLNVADVIGRDVDLFIESDASSDDGGEVSLFVYDGLSSRPNPAHGPSESVRVVLDGLTAGELGASFNRGSGRNATAGRTGL
jgi:hypothetical protein